MAGIIVNNPTDPSVIYANQYTSVWIKPYWGAEWRYAPYLFPATSSERAAPADSTATYTWEFGTFLNLWNNAGATLLPINIENWFIKTEVHTQYGTFISWIGVVVGETMTEEGIDSVTGVQRGVQTLECRGLEYLLERRNVLGCYVGDATAWAYLPRTRDFNVSSDRETLTGNRSASINTYSGTYLFSDDGNKWSNLQIANYLISGFQPWYPWEVYRGQVQYVPLFYIVGQTDGLDLIFQEHRLHGLTVREALNRLIDRKRGYGWRIATNGVGAIYIVVFSLAQSGIAGANTYIPPNPRQIDVSIHDDRWIEAQYRISSMSQVDEIVVESDRPVVTVCTPGFDLGTLEEAWDPDLDENLPDEDDYYETLAAQLIPLFDEINTSAPAYGRISFYEFNAYTGLDLEVYNVLDYDGDGWITMPDLEANLPGTTYQTATEDERASDKFDAVYSHYQVPRAWTWEGWVPHINDNGVVDVNTRGPYAWWRHSFLRELPWKEEGLALDAEPEYLEPFAVIAKPSRDRDIVLALAIDGNAPYTLEEAQAVVTNLTEGEFNNLANAFDEIDWADIQAAFEENPYKFIQLDKAEQLEYPACAMRMADTGLKVIVKSKANHVFAHNHWDGEGAAVAPVFDYYTLLPTVAFETDAMPRVRLPIWVNTYVDPLDPTATLQGEGSPTGKQIYIQVPGKEVWMAAPWTVRKIDDGDLVYANTDAPGSAMIIRDDTDDLRTVALVAYIWWGQQRASVDLMIKNQLNFFILGDLIRSTVSGHQMERIGTCVTGIERDYQNGTHRVTTGYGELDPVAFTDEYTK